MNTQAHIKQILIMFVYLYESRLKISQADQITHMECDQMRFVFQYNPPCGPHTFSIGIADLGSHWSLKSSKADMTSSYELFNPSLYLGV